MGDPKFFSGDFLVTGFGRVSAGQFEMEVFPVRDGNIVGRPVRRNIHARRFTLGLFTEFS